MKLARAHPRLAALAMALLLAMVVLIVAAARSRNAAGCSAPAPVPQLPARLRVLGEFDQPYPAAETRTIQDAALKAASALHADLGGSGTTFAGDPVHIRGLAPADHDAEVIPLGTDIGPDGVPRRVEGLVAFLHDCQGQLYYDTVADLAAQPPAAFPSVDRDAALTALGARDVELVYTLDPLQPVWRDPASGRTLAATVVPTPFPGFTGPTP